MSPKNRKKQADDKDGRQAQRKAQRQKFSLIRQIRTNKKAYAVYITLSAIVTVIIIRSAFNNQWESVYICGLTLLLFMIPPFLEKSMKVELPSTLEILAFIFIFCAEILGEIASFYVRVPLWDTLLHTVCGFMFAAFGFCLIDVFNRGRFNKFDMSPLFLAFVAFCFSMTVGVFWEFIEFSIDNLLSIDMQKDVLVQDLYTVTLDPTNSNKVVAVGEVVSTVIEQADGSTVVLEGGYLDIGLYDTMKDLLVNFVGAIVFSAIGFFYVKQRGKGVIARQFIPKTYEELLAEQEEQNDIPATDKNVDVDPTE